MPATRRPDSPVETVRHILGVFSGLKELKGLDAILDRILLESRRLANADAGAVYLMRDGRLHFNHVHNDTLFTADDVNKQVYLRASLPVSESSIAGYAALRGEPLSFDDAYAIDPAYPCRLNASFDEKTGYRTKSMLTLPIINSQARVIAVMQIINAKDEEGRTTPFTEEAKGYISLLANHAASAIEAGLMTHELVMRMIRMAQMRDPGETGAHVQRVGAYCAEIFHRIAVKRGLCQEEIKRRKDLARIASMLHDVGKVGVPDGVLKKPGPLNGEELAVMRRHCIHGAKLFERSHSELDVMAGEIALYHHRRFDGGGYPEEFSEINEESGMRAAPLSGTDIPLHARTAALADVFDALVSPRVYKAPWPVDKALDYVRAESGKQFDPEVVEAFLEIQDVVLAIMSRFSEILQPVP